MSKFYITTPIYYVNDKPHIGHAYTTIAADVLARYHRLIGDVVFFSTGTDEHGKKIQQIAEAKKMLPQQFCDGMVKDFKLAWQKLNISYDKFIRTTQKDHIKTTQWVLSYLYQNNYLYKGEYQSFYCVGCEQYKQKSDLIKGRCPDHGTVPEVHKEEAYLFRMSQFQNCLADFIKKDKLLIEPKERKNEVLSFIKGGLEDIAISRRKTDVYWGITLPFDSRHTVYVWLDALLNYLTVLGWSGDEKISEFWPPDVQLMGKDILRIHATFWPSLLLALNLPLPQRLFVHGYFTINGQKMSKSRGNIIDPIAIVEKYGTDAFRYFILREVSFGKDGDFSMEKLKQRYNADLVNDLGNLVQRIMVMVSRYLKGKIPVLKIEKAELPSIRELQEQTKIAAAEIKKFDKLVNELKFDEILVWIWQKVRLANQLVETSKPWILVKNNPQKLEKVLNDLVSSIVEIAWFLLPFMPETAEKIINIYKGPKIKLEKPLFPRIV